MEPLGRQLCSSLVVQAWILQWYEVKNVSWLFAVMPLPLFFVTVRLHATLPKGKIFLPWHDVKLGMLCICAGCAFFFFRQSCTIFLGRWLMSVLVVTNFKPLVYIHTVHASFSVVLILYSCYNTLPRTTSFMFQLPAPRHSMLQKILSCLREKNV